MFEIFKLTSFCLTLNFNLSGLNFQAWIVKLAAMQGPTAE
jgi:hypothetical protein